MNATVGDVKTSPATTITPRTGLKQAAALLRSGGLCPHCDEPVAHVDLTALA